MVEAKCINVDLDPEPFRSSATGKSDYWQALIALHRTLLHEHHDFFLATQHPSASPALRTLATKYGMPYRMWQHGIHSFLKLLRAADLHQPHLEHMTTFLHYVKQLMTALHENLPCMDEEWTKIEMALGEYESILTDFQSTSFGDLVYQPPSSESSPENIFSASPVSLFRYIYERTAPCLQRKDGKAEFGDLHSQQDEFPTASETSDSSWIPSVNTLRLPQYVANTLGGWIYFGQSIAWDFNIYAKTFGILSIAAKHYCDFFIKFF